MGFFKLAIGCQSCAQVDSLLLMELQPAIVKMQLRCSHPNKQHIGKTMYMWLMMQLYANTCKIMLHIG